MYRNTLGISGRGTSNSIASPGVSVLFGQMPTLQKPSRFDQFQAASSSQYTHQRPQTQGSKPSSSLTPAKPAPVQQSKQAAPKSVPAVQSEVSVSTPKPVPTQKSSTQRKEWNVPEFKAAKAPAPAQSCPFDSSQYRVEGIVSRDAPLSFGALQERYRQEMPTKAEVNNHAIPPTDLQARLVYRHHAHGLPSTREIAEAVQEDIQASKAELAQAHVQQQRELSQELSAQVKNEHRRQEDYKQALREAHKASPGFDFEYYQRHPRMLEEARRTGQFVKSQKTQDQRRKDHEVEQSKQLPSKDYLTAEKYQELSSKQKCELEEAKRGQQTDLRSAYDKATDAARQAARDEIAQKREHERARIEAIKHAISAENHRKRQQKFQDNQEMNSTLNTIERRKRAEWDAKVNDTSNKKQSLKQQKDTDRLKAELQTNVSKAKREYFTDLSTQKTQYSQLQDLDKQKHQRILGEKEGFEFECYSRDKVIAQEKRATLGFVEKQREDQIWKKAIEKEDQIRPPQNLIDQATRK